MDNDSSNHYSLNQKTKRGKSTAVQEFSTASCAVLRGASLATCPETSSSGRRGRGRGRTMTEDRVSGHGSVGGRRSAAPHRDATAIIVLSNYCPLCPSSATAPDTARSSCDDRLHAPLRVVCTPSHSEERCEIKQTDRDTSSKYDWQVVLWSSRHAVQGFISILIP